MPDLGDDAESMLEAVASLSPLLDEGFMEIEPVAQEIAAAPDLGLSEEGRAPFTRRLVRLLRLEPLGLASRARDIVSDYERVFHDARILTDIRPVFGSDPSTAPRAAAVTATLKVDYHPGGRRGLESLFFAMDRADLTMLQAQVERALQKTDQLIELLSRAKLPYWEYMDPDATDH